MPEPFANWYKVEGRKIVETNQQYPSLGFYLLIAKEILTNVLRYILNPLPFVKW